MGKVHRLVERRTNINNIRKWKNNNLNIKVMIGKFEIHDNNKISWNGKRNHWNEHNISYNKRYSICTYLHYYDNEDKPFYIGQGTIARAFNTNKGKNRTKAWKDKVKDENLVRVVIYKMDITKAESLKLEKELIYKYFKFNCLVNLNKNISEYSNYSENPNINRSEVGAFDLKGNLIKTFESIDKAAYEYFTSPFTIRTHIKKEKAFRGIIIWKRL